MTNKTQKYANAVGVFFCRQRIKKGLSRNDVAKAIGKSRTWYYDIENARSRISLLEADKLCGFFDTTLLELRSAVHLYMGEEFPVLLKENKAETFKEFVLDHRQKYIDKESELEGSNPNQSGSDTIFAGLDKYSAKKTLGNFLKSKRKNAGYTLTEVSRQLSHTSTWLSEIENGKKNPALYDLAALARLYDFTFSEVQNIYDAHILIEMPNVEINIQCNIKEEGDAQNESYTQK